VLLQRVVDVATTGHHNSQTATVTAGFMCPPLARAGGDRIEVTKSTAVIAPMAASAGRRCAIDSPEPSDTSQPGSAAQVFIGSGVGQRLTVGAAVSADDGLHGKPPLVDGLA
jgi:hypothetical protein